MAERASKSQTGGGSSNEGSKLGTGAIVGIVIAVVAVVAAIIIAVVLVLKKKNNSLESSGSLMQSFK